jgi:CHASE2 domain-containing sensor protein
MNTSAKIGIAILGLMSLGNVPSVLTTDGAHPPMAIAAVLTAIGIAGLVLAVLAWRRNRPSLIALVILSALGALSAVPAFTAEGVPAALQVVAGVAIGITAVGIALVVPAMRRRPTPVVA